jgi:hypothetical protein
VYPAFSGLGSDVNRSIAACSAGNGPIPQGRYYIIDRESGGMLGAVRDAITGRGEWFALYAADKNIDDYTFCNEVRRGNFRLHPKGPRGISNGCIVIESEIDFRSLRHLLRSKAPTPILGTKYAAYGMLTVR